MAAEAMLHVEVAYGTRAEQIVVALSVPPGTTVSDAIALSRIAERCGELEIATHAGIYGRVVAPETILTDGDRVEIYRALIADPKQARRRRAARTR